MGEGRGHEITRGTAVSLRHDIAHLMRCELKLLTGRTITLDSLDQHRTHAGLLEGTPNALMNNSNIEWALRQAERRCIDGAKPQLLAPQRRDYCREPGDMDELVARRPHHIPEWLPNVWCIGSFTSSVTSRNPDMHMSTLTVVWFQDEFAMPILEPALGQLLALDWESLATDFEY
jgi:hypothetical protein